MNASEWVRVKQLLIEAAERPEADRQRYVIEQCEDPELLQEVLAMLASPAPLSDIVTAATLHPGESLGFLGTWRYIAPEQLDGAEADPRSDTWAFGCLIYEMLTGQAAFDAASQAGLIAAILERQPTPLTSVHPTISPLLDHLVRRCLEKSPDDRWQSAADIRHVLQWISDSIGDTKSTGGTAAAAPSVTRRVVGGIAATAGVVLLTVWAIFFQRSHLDPARSAMRLAISLPDSVREAQYLSLSADGKLLAYAGRPRDGSAWHLWVRPIDSQEARQLSGLALSGPAHPFLSPDGRSIGFFANGKLERVDVATGAIQVICDAPNGRGGAWGRDGIIIFSPDLNSKLFRVPAAGGSPVPLTSVQGTTSHRLPSFLADGNRFVFTAVESDGTSRFMIGSLDSPATAELMVMPATSRSPNSVSQAYVAGNWLLFARDRSVSAQRIDTQQWRLVGDAALVAQDVALDDNGRQAFAVAGDGVLVFRSRAPFMRQLTWLDRRGLSTGTLWEPGQLADLSISPDGQHATVSRLDIGDIDANIWTIELARGAASRLTTRSSEVPLWSADSQSVFFGNRVGLLDGEIRKKKADGSGPDESVVASPPGRKVPIGWSANGSLLFTVTNKSGGRDLFQLRSGQRDADLIAVADPSTDFGRARVSRDGGLIAYDAGGGLYIQGLPNEPRVLVTSGGARLPRWREDGRELFYVANGKLVAVDVARDKTIHVGNPQPQFDLGGDALDWAPTPDGQRFLVELPVATGAVAARLNVVLNWSSLINR